MRTFPNCRWPENTGIFYQINLPLAFSSFLWFAECFFRSGGQGEPLIQIIFKSFDFSDVLRGVPAVLNISTRNPLWL
jgi:hypothetical protein